MLGIDQRDDAVQPRKLLDLLVHKKGLRHGRRVGHPSGLDDDPVEVELAGLDAL